MYLEFICPYRVAQTYELFMSTLPCRPDSRKMSPSPSSSSSSSSSLSWPPPPPPLSLTASRQLGHVWTKKLRSSLHFPLWPSHAASFSYIGINFAGWPSSCTSKWQWHMPTNQRESSICIPGSGRSVGRPDASLPQFA